MKIGVFPGCSVVENSPAMQKTRLGKVRSLYRDRSRFDSISRFDPWLGKIPWRRKVATHSSFLAWRILWTEEPGRLESMGSQRV